jgi:hypothetical protein
MNQPVRKSRVTYWVEILALRSRELADRVAAGELGFVDGVDMANSAAERAGLAEAVGDDVVHAALAAAFGNARRLVAVRRLLQRW